MVEGGKAERFASAPHGLAVLSHTAGRCQRHGEFAHLLPCSLLLSSYSPPHLSNPALSPLTSLLTTDALSSPRLSFLFLYSHTLNSSSLSTAPTFSFSSSLFSSFPPSLFASLSFSYDLSHPLLSFPLLDQLNLADKARPSGPSALGTTTLSTLELSRFSRYGSFSNEKVHTQQFPVV
jgi:hypothetical protein